MHKNKKNIKKNISKSGTSQYISPLKLGVSSQFYIDELKKLITKGPLCLRAQFPDETNVSDNTLLLINLGRGKSIVRGFTQRIGIKWVYPKSNSFHCAQAHYLLHYVEAEDLLRENNNFNIQYDKDIPEISITLSLDYFFSEVTGPLCTKANEYNKISTLYMIIKLISAYVDSNEIYEYHPDHEEKYKITYDSSLECFEILLGENPIRNTAAETSNVKKINMFNKMMREIMGISMGISISSKQVKKDDECENQIKKHLLQIEFALVPENLNLEDLNLNLKRLGLLISGYNRRYSGRLVSSDIEKVTARFAAGVNTFF